MLEFLDTTLVIFNMIRECITVVTGGFVRLFLSKIKKIKDYIGKIVLKQLSQRK